MDFLLTLIDAVTGPDTEIVELLPIVVLVAVLIAMRYLRSLLLRVLGEIGALRAEFGIKRMLEEKDLQGGK